jgi:hypothetical protein
MVNKMQFAEHRNSSDKECLMGVSHGVPTASTRYLKRFEHCRLAPGPHEHLVRRSPFRPATSGSSRSLPREY